MKDDSQIQAIVSKDNSINNISHTMIPSINNWFYIESEKPLCGSVVLACINNTKFEFKTFTRFPVIPILFSYEGFFSLLDMDCLMDSGIKFKCRPIEDIIVWQPMPNPPYDLREKDSLKKGKYYSHGKFFDNEEDFFKHSMEWIDLEFDYSEFCNQVRMMMSAVILNSEMRGESYTNREAYHLARIQMGWGEKSHVAEKEN